MVVEQFVIEDYHCASDRRLTINTFLVPALITHY